MPKHTKSERIKRRAFHEVKHNEPKVVSQTRAKKGAPAARRQLTAIALSKARRAGARISKR